MCWVYRRLRKWERICGKRVLIALYPNLLSYVTEGKTAEGKVEFWFACSFFFFGNAATRIHSCSFSGFGEEQRTTATVLFRYSYSFEQGSGWQGYSQRDPMTIIPLLFFLFSYVLYIMTSPRRKHSVQRQLRHFAVASS